MGLNAKVTIQYYNKDGELVTKVNPAYVPMSSGLLTSGSALDKSSVSNCGTLHSDYVKALPRWTLCEDVMSGEDTVRSKGSLYCPKPSGQSDEEFAAFLLRASFTNATGRAHDGLEGLIYRKKPSSRLPTKLEELTNDITTTGATLDELSKTITDHILTTGRGGLLLEYPITEQVPGKSVAEAEKNGERPYVAFYEAKDILNWREGKVNNKRQLTWVKLREWDELVDSVDSDKTAYVEIIREIMLDENGNCIQKVYVGGYKENVTPKVMPIIINNEPINYIPFVFVGTIDTSSKIRKSPIYDIAIKNIHHWQLSADRRHALHWADNPTAIIFGQIITADGKPLEIIKLGSSEVINVQQGGDAKFLEFMGNGLAPTKLQMDEDMAEMAILLSRILAGDTKAAEAAETAAIHRVGENAVLAAIANAISTAITKILTIMANWIGAKGEVSYKLNTNFYPTPMTSQMLIALTNSLISNAISPEEFYDALVAGDVIRPDKTYDEHKKEIDAAPKTSVKKEGPINAPGPADELGGPKGPPSKSGA